MEEKNTIDNAPDVTKEQLLSVIKEDSLESMPSIWGNNKSSQDAIIRYARELKQTGPKAMMSQIPIICQGMKCAYSDSCPMTELDVDIDSLHGERCPVEVATILNKFNHYVDHFEIDPEKTDQIIIGLIRDLIDYDIQIERANKIMSQQGDFREERVVGIANNGTAVKEKGISNAVEYKAKCKRERESTLQLLHSTPKDKKGSILQLKGDPSTYAATLMQKARVIAQEEAEAEDVDYEEVD